jgi:hypothetical protein
VVWAHVVAKALPLGAGLLLADRVTRDRALRVDDLLTVTPAGLLVRLLGKYLGSTLATLLPIAAVYAAGVAVLAARWHDAADLAVAPAAFAVACIPSVLFVAAFALACTTVLWPLLFQFLFVGYWFWANYHTPGDIPTLNGTLLTPDDDFIIRGVFPLDAYWPHATLMQAALSAVLLLGCAAGALLAAWRWLCWRAERR